jgi:aminobenzoyl-glutamate transport protein
MTAATAPVQRTAMGRLLDLIETAGNKVPHPVLMFLYLIIGVIVLSQLLALAGVSVTDQIVVPDEIPVTPNYYEDTVYPQGAEGDVLANGFHI